MLGGTINLHIPSHVTPTPRLLLKGPPDANERGIFLRPARAIVGRLVLGAFGRQLGHGLMFTESQGLMAVLAEMIRRGVVAPAVARWIALRSVPVGGGGGGDAAKGDRHA
jgi:hypothetical protein